MEPKTNHCAEFFLKFTPMEEKYKHDQSHFCCCHDQWLSVLNLTNNSAGDSNWLLGIVVCIRTTAAVHTEGDEANNKDTNNHNNSDEPA